MVHTSKPERGELMLVQALVKPKCGGFSARMIDDMLIITTKSEAKNGKANAEIINEIKKMLRKDGYEGVEIKIHCEKSKKKMLEIEWQKNGNRDLKDVFE